MRVKIVTDSTSDIPPELVKNSGIEIVPGYVQFGRERYRDCVDISKSGFYQKLAEPPFHPVTLPATPRDFAGIYSRCIHETEGIVSVHISSKISKMFNSAQRGKTMVKDKHNIVVIDSHFTSIGLGLIVIAAARLADAGASLEEVVNETKRAISQISMLGFFDTMKYVARGGRASKHVVELSSILNIKPLLTFRDGEIAVEGLVRTHSDGIDKLYEFVRDFPEIEDLAIAYSTGYDSAVALKQRLGSVFPEQKTYIDQMCAALGAHCGPDALFVALRRAK